MQIVCTPSSIALLSSTRINTTHAFIMYSLSFRTDKCVLASSGMQADILALQKNLKAMLQVINIGI